MPTISTRTAFRRSALTRAAVAAALVVGSTVGTATAADALTIPVRPTPVKFERLTHPVSVARDVVTGHYWILTADGTVHHSSGAVDYGSPIDRAGFAGETAVSMSAMPTDKGYWVLTSDGHVYAFGSARQWGQPADDPHLAGRTPVAITANHASSGYRVLLSDGTVVGYNATAINDPFGTTKTQPAPAIDIETDSTDDGYRVLHSDGTVTSFGAAVPYRAPVLTGETAVDLVPSSTTGGYWIVTASGGMVPVHAPDYGSDEGTAGYAGHTAIGATALQNGKGYSIVRDDGHVVTHTTVVHSATVSAAAAAAGAIAR